MASESKGFLPLIWLSLLGGFARLYGAGMRFHRFYSCLAVKRLPCPVVCVGNIVAGGTGKTSFVALLAKQLLRQGVRPAVLLRGYGSRRKAPLIVSDGAMIFARPPLAGDEAFLLSTKLKGVPILTGADRHRAGSEAVAHFRPDLLLLDDGFQHRKLHRDLDIVMLNGSNPFGYGHLLPRGLLREPPEALGSAGLLVVTLDKLSGLGPLRVSLRRYAPEVPILLVVRRPCSLLSLADGKEQDLSTVRGKRVLVFSGIGNPPSFDALLGKLAVNVLEHRIFPDHYHYRPQDFASLLQAAKEAGAEALLTTEKDAARITHPIGGIPVLALRVELEIIEGEGNLKQAVENVLHGWRGKT